MTLDARAGTITRTDENASDPNFYTFEFQYFAPARVEIVASKTTVIADGADTVTLSVTCEDVAASTVSIMVYNIVDEVRVPIGAFDIALSSGAGDQIVTYAEAGDYLYCADTSVEDATWNVPKCLTIIEARVEAVNA
jgi:hypothetical protein